MSEEANIQQQVEFGATEQPLMSKRGDIFALCGHDGDINARRDQAEGLFYNDMRFLDRLCLSLDGSAPRPLLAWGQGESVGAEVTRPLRPGEQPGAQNRGIRRLRSMGNPVEERIEVTNYSPHPAEARLEVSAGSGFDDIFTIRNGNPGRRGKLLAPRWSGDSMVLEYQGADGIERTTTLEFDSAPERRDGSTAGFTLRIPPHETRSVELRIGLHESNGEGGGLRPAAPRAGFGGCRVETGNPEFQAALERSLADLRMLLSSRDGLTFVSAGMPWFAALFGRDSLITAFQTIAFDASIARDTLRLLAQWQGSRFDEERGEQPGKILHELRVGEKAHLHEIPQHPSYATVDATPLFLVLMGEYCDWTGDLELARSLRPNLERALDWIDGPGDSDGDGFLDYRSGPGEPHNQCWKDSDNSIPNADGSLAEQPLALVEVQGYVYRAKLSMASVFEALGDRERAGGLRQQAAELKDRFNRAFRWDAEDFYYLALQRGGRPVETVASNPGQALWSGIVSDEHAASVARRLLRPDCFSGWGIRTLASGQAAYNPIDYQVGAVWPHDNSLIAAGFLRHGLAAEAHRVVEGTLAAAAHFSGSRLPELFSGEARREFPGPVRYPHACTPQAWAAGSVPYLLRSLLGLAPSGGDTLLLRPRLPEFLPWVELRDLRVGRGRVDLRFSREGDRTRVETLSVEGVSIEAR